MPDITQITADQVIFKSAATGDTTLDTYLEAAEKGGRSLADLLSDLFDGAGVILTTLWEFRVDQDTHKLQFRTDGQVGWRDTDQYIFRPRGDWAPSQDYEVLDLVNYSGNTYITKTKHTSDVTFDPAKFHQLRGGLPQLSGVSDARKLIRADDNGQNYTIGAAVSAFVESLLDSADAAALRAAIGSTAVGDALFTAVDAASARAALGLGDLALENAPLAVSKGGTGASDAPNARANLGATTIGDALFTAANAVAARQALQIDVIEDLTPFANADFTIWQRGATALDAGGGGLATSNWANANPHYGPDQWLFQRGASGAGTVTRQLHALGQTDVPGARYYAKMTITVAGTGDMTIRRRIPGVHRFAGQDIAFALYIRTNLAGRTVTPKIRQVFGSGGSPSAAVEVDADPVDLEQNEWVLVPAVVSVPPVAGKTLGANGDDYLELQWNLGEAAVGEWDFSRFILTPGSELGPPIVLPPALDEAICGWFLDVIGGDASNQAVGEGLCTATTTAVINIHFRPKRAAPTITPSNVAHFQVINSAGSAIASTNIAFSQISRRSAVATVTTGGSLTAGQGAILQVSAAGRRLDISAEL